MTTVMCQHSGLNFEAKTKRTKQHPLVASLKNDAHRDGNYSEVLAALDKVAEAGGYEYETIEEYLNLVDEILTGKAEAAKAVQAQEVQWHKKQAEKSAEAKDRRQERNRLLRQNGYRWSKGYADFDEYEEGEPSAWNLHSPDDRIVTEAQAFDEIKRGSDVVLAELFNIIEGGEGDLPYDVILDGVLLTAKNRGEQLREKIDACRDALWVSAKDLIKTSMVEVEKFDYIRFNMVFQQQIGDHIRRRIYAGQISGIDCAVICGSLAGHYFYSVDFNSAGLTPVSESRKC